MTPGAQRVVAALLSRLLPGVGSPLVGRALERARAGAEEYGDRSLQRSPRALVREIEEELADVLTWSAILDVVLEGRPQTERVVALRCALRELAEALHRLEEQEWARVRRAAVRLEDEEDTTETAIP